MSAMNLLKKFAQDFPGIWEIMDRLHKEYDDCNKDTQPKWSVSDASIGQYLSTKIGYNNLDAYNLGTLLESLWNWRSSKEVFIFDKDFEELNARDRIDKIPAEAFHKTPYPCFYIKTRNISFDGMQADGFL